MAVADAFETVAVHPLVAVADACESVAVLDATMAPHPFEMPVRGDYVEQTMPLVRGRTKLPWYLLPPSIGGDVPALHEGLDAGTIFGPVHAVQSTWSTHGFVSVLVPTPSALLSQAERHRLPSLVWINVFKNRDREGRPDTVFWARRVPDTTVQSWRNQGWQDVMLD